MGEPTSTPEWTDSAMTTDWLPEFDSHPQKNMLLGSLPSPFSEVSQSAPDRLGTENTPDQAVFVLESVLPTLETADDQEGIAR